MKRTGWEVCLSTSADRFAQLGGGVTDGFAPIVSKGQHLMGIGKILAEIVVVLTEQARQP